MIVAVGSMWRDSAGYIDRSLKQFEGLARLFDQVYFGFAENASTDFTDDRLHAWAESVWPAARIRHVRDDCPYYPSVDIPDRWRHLAWVSNQTIELIPAEADIFLYVESDLTWDPQDLARLVQMAADDGAAHAACNVADGGRWYDTWGSRLNGERFQAGSPHHSQWSDSSFLVDSTCGALALPADVARATRFQPEDCYVGWCRDIWANHCPIWLEPDIKVIHA